ncbi:MAG TPA: class I SAM-dependent methyltransferase [Xanthobacteraceae bacterium]
MTVSRVQRDCPLCGAGASQARPLQYRTPEFQLVQCQACDLVFVDQLPPQHEFEDERAWEVSSVSHAAQRKRDYPVLVALQQMTRYRMHVFKRDPKQILARHVRPGPIVEVGCASGVNLTPPPKGFIPYGVEISKSLAAKADAEFRPFGGQCLQMPAEEGLQRFPRGFFHGALLIGYLEHEYFPRQALTRLREVVSDEAVVLVKMPNFASINRRLMGMRWSGFRFPDHVNYYTPSTLREMARRAGFTTHFSVPDVNPLSDSLWGLLRPA